MSFDVKALVGSRTDQRVKGWEVDFEKNHKAFAEELAVSIAKHVLENLETTFKDLYAKIPDSEKPDTYNYSLDITNIDSAKKIKEYAKDKAELAPFKEWFSKFTTEAPKSDEKLPVVKQLKTDYKYFQVLMAIVGETAKVKLDEFFINLTSEQKNADLQFRVEWFGKSDKNQSGINSSSISKSFPTDTLQVKVWYKDPQNVENTEILKETKTVSQFRNNLDKKEQTRSRISLLAFALFFSVIVVGMRYRFRH